MPSDQFEVESYELTVDPRGYVTHIIFLTSPAMSHGIRTRAYINFLPASKLPSALGWAFNVGGLNYDGITAYCYADERYFDAMYHVLQTEASVTFEYGYQTASSTGELYDFRITTAAQPTGEGLVEAAALPLVAAGELDLDALTPQDLSVEDVEILRPAEGTDIEVTAK